jgi:hypothetical protein
METQTVSSPAKPPVKARTALQRETSRRNGSRSKGPKTPEGKARSSRNARLHALGVPAIADPAFHQQVTEFALALAGPDADRTALALATVMAAAQIDVQRARLAACAVMSGMKADSSTTYSKAVRRWPGSNGMSTAAPCAATKPCGSCGNGASHWEDRQRRTHDRAQTGGLRSRRWRRNSNTRAQQRLANRCGVSPVQPERRRKRT